MRRGRQTPTFERVGICDHSDGPDAVALFEGYGVRFIPAQEYEMDLYLAKNELTASATLTARRRIGSDGVGFEDAGGADATLIEACALALWQAKTTKRRPGRKAVVY